MKVIEVIIAPNGESKVQTKGFVGSDCQQASKFLEAALGKRTSEQLTPEYYAQQVSQQSAEEGQ